MKQMMILTVVVAATWTGRSAGAGMDPAEVLGPFVDEKTLAVIRVDPSGVDLNVLAAMIVRMAKTDEDRTHLQVRTGAATVAIKAWTRDFKAAGGDDLYMVITLTEWPLRPWFVVAPLTPRGRNNDERLKDLLSVIEIGDPTKLETAIMPSAVVRGPEKTLSRLERVKGFPQPDLDKAFKAARTGPIQFALIPHNDSIPLFDQILTTLPFGVDQISKPDITSGLAWAAGTVHTRREVSIDFMIQSPSPDAAKSLRSAIRQVLGSYGEHAVYHRRIKQANWDRIHDALSPHTNRNQLRFALDRGRADPLISQHLGPLVREEWKAHLQMVAMRRALTIHMACIRYAEQQDDKRLPPELGALMLGDHFSPGTVLSPTSAKKVPRDFDDWTENQQVEWVNSNSSFIVLPKQKLPVQESDIILFEKPQEGDGKHVVVTYGNNAAIPERIELANQLIMEQTGRSLADWSKEP